MSHFTNIKTRFQNELYLEKALQKLGIIHQKSEKNIINVPNNIKIFQSNGYDLEFRWNGQEYDFIVDMSFWEQAYPIENFIDKIVQEYAGEVIINEGQKIGFQPVTYKQNKDGSNTLVLERWNVSIDS